MDRGVNALPGPQARPFPGILQERSALEVQVRAPRRNREESRVAEVPRQVVSSLGQFPGNPGKNKQFRSRGQRRLHSVEWPYPRPRRRIALSATLLLARGKFTY